MKNKSVPNLENETNGDGPSVLYYELMMPGSKDPETNIRWNVKNGNTEGWGSSRIRAVLNGNDDLINENIANPDIATGGYTVDKYNDTNCLFAAFPDELKSAIGQKAVKYDSVYNDKSTDNLKVSYDYLWLLSPNEIWSEAQNSDPVYSHPLEGKQYLRFQNDPNIQNGWSASGQSGTRGYMRPSETASRSYKYYSKY